MADQPQIATADLARWTEQARADWPHAWLRGDRAAQAHWIAYYAAREAYDRVFTEVVRVVTEGTA